MAALIVEPFNGKFRMLAQMSSRGKLGLSASHLCRVLSLLCILAPSTIPDNPFLVCPLLRPQLLTIHPIFIGIIPLWLWILFLICIGNFSLGFKWDHALDFNPRSSLGVSSFSWLVDLLLSSFHLLPLFCLMKDIPVLVKKGDFHESDGSLTGVPENVIDKKWAFETRFVATRGIVSAFSSRDHLSSVMILHCCSVVA